MSMNIFYKVLFVHEIYDDTAFMKIEYKLGMSHADSNPNKEQNKKMQTATQTKSNTKLRPPISIQRSEKIRRRSCSLTIMITEVFKYLAWLYSNYNECTFQLFKRNVCNTKPQNMYINREKTAHRRLTKAIFVHFCYISVQY